MDSNFPWIRPPERLRQAYFEACGIGPNHGVEARIGGSYVVDPDTAKDIDVVYVCCDVGRDKGYWKRYGFEWQTNENGNVAEVVYETDHAIQGHWRKGLLNLIAVRPEYWAAYMAAINEMVRNPQLYDTREKRAFLHRTMRNKVRFLMDPDADLE